MSNTSYVYVQVTKGCKPLGISKGTQAALLFSAHPGYGVKAWGFNGHNLWMSGNQKKVPADFPVGKVINFNDGNPIHKVTVVVKQLASFTPDKAGGVFTLA